MAKAVKIKPIGDRVLVKHLEEKEQVRGGIIIPDAAKEKPQEAEVIALGTGKKDENGKAVAFEVKVGDKVLKGKGELLSLTAKEAAETYGEPPEPLLAAGTAKDVPDLLRQKFGEKGYVATTLQITWSEKFAVLLRSVVPVLLGLGLLALGLVGGAGLVTAGWPGVEPPPLGLLGLGKLGSLAVVGLVALILAGFGLAFMGYRAGR